MAARWALTATVASGAVANACQRLEVIVWRTDDETPVLVSLVDINESPTFAVTLQVTDTEEREQD